MSATAVAEIQDEAVADAAAVDFTLQRRGEET